MRRLLAVLAILCLAISATAFAQTTNATLGGSVSDATGALIPGVSVSATNTATGIVSTTLTNESGVYQFASLQTGTYKVTAELTGFQAQVVNNFALGIGAQARQNFVLQVGSVSTQVDVSVDANSMLKTTSASVGTVLPQATLQDLPLGSRNIQQLISLSAGTGPQGEDGGIYGNFAGGRISAVNVTRDGFVNSDGRYNHGEFSQTYTSPDLVEEVKIITATVDAENGRGSGQVQMSTRSGSNAFKGSLFWTNRNSKWDAASWSNNLNGVVADWENRNQFGGRIGGPIIKNKTFFFFLLDEQRDVVKTNVLGTVLTPLARQGIYRFFGGVDNQNAGVGSANPTVDKAGNPVRPANATSDLQQFSVFTTATGGVRDPFRPGLDPTGFVSKNLIGVMPLPNDWTTGDGLNTAGIRFTRRTYGTDVADGNSGDQNNRDQFNVRIDHNFNSKNKLSGVWTQERSIDHSGQAGLRSYPNGFDGSHNKWPRLYTLSMTSTLSSKMVNEARFGLRRSAIASIAPFYVGRNIDGTGTPTGTGAEAFKLMPQANGIPFQPTTTFIGTNGFMNWGAGFGSTRSSRSPLWQYGDNFSVNVGKHSFKTGFEVRRDETNAWNDNDMTPKTPFGALAGFAVTGIDGNVVAGTTLSANNQSAARTLMTDLAGSISSIREGFDLPNATAVSQFLGYKDGYKMHDRDWHSNEMSIYFKDDWKVTSALTLNVGIHWEYFGVPYEGKGRAGQPVGGNEKGACGFSCGALTVSQFVGKNSTHPSLSLYGNDYNNIAPSVGFSYSLPWFGKDKTIVRGGYGWAYTGGALKGANGTLDSAGGSSPGATELSGGGGITFVPTVYTNMANVSLPIAHQFAPLTAVPIDGPRTVSLTLYATNRVNPYVQNFNFELQREVTKSLTVDVAYVGSKGTRLFGGRNINIADIYAQAGGETLLQAFKETRAGLNAPFFDALLKGINIGGGASLVNGTTSTGSQALRTNTTTRAQIANGNVGALANFLNTSTSGTNGIGGGLYTINGFPQNFFVTNPQFGSVTYNDSSVSSTYHSLQVTTTKRLSHGITNQFSYTFSKALGISDGDGVNSPRDPNNRSLEKGRLGFDRTHALSSNGTIELPFGPNRRFLDNAPAWVQRLTERWQLGGIFSYGSGQPLTFTSGVSSIYTAGLSYPVVLGAIPHDTGTITKLANGVQYFNDWTTGIDPASATVTTLNSTSTSFSNRAVFGKDGKPLMVNPEPGTIGNLGKNQLTGPGNVGLDANLIKRVKLAESKEFELRLDAVNILNHPNFANPTVAISSTSFGRITSASGSRRFTLNARVNF